MKILELFSGTGILSKTFKDAGHETLTIDNNPELKPDICVNILDFDIKMLPKEWRKPNIIWASPPCQKFSVLTIPKYWTNGKPKSWKTYLHLAIVKKTTELIKELAPTYWFIENPVGMLRKQEFMCYQRKTVTYCQYGENYRKPTDIWTNASHWVPKRACSVLDGCHTKVKRGENKGIQGVTELKYISNWDGQGSIKRAKLPKKLCIEILKVCENKQKIKQENLIENWGNKKNG